MTCYADLHIHSRYSRATSRDCDLEHLAVWAQRKGIAIVGTGDFTHPAWREEMRDKLELAEPGLFRLRPDLAAGLGREVPAACQAPVRFMLSSEISTIYKKGDRTRKVHHLVYASNFETVDRIVARLSRIGNLASDGRPILGLDSRHLLEIVLESGPDAYLIPAHVWTPWFSVLGSRSGFDAVDDCYGDLAPHVFALETGLSSDPPMNWRISSLDRFRLVSNSDAHSPAKLGREATAFDIPLDYFALRRALETGVGYVGTVEFFPEEGKYHMDGHRKCDVRLTPRETRAAGGLCPVCGKPVTVGVSHRVEELADRDEAIPPSTAGEVLSLVPLPEVLSEICGTGPQSKAVQRMYDTITSRLGPELFVLGEAPLDEIRHGTSDLVADAVARLRKGDVTREAGYDGEYGRIRLFTDDELANAPLVRFSTLLTAILIAAILMVGPARAQSGLEEVQKAMAPLQAARQLVQLLDDGKPADALAQAQRLLPQLRTTLGPQHPLTLLCMMTVAAAQDALGQTAAARAMCREFVPVLIHCAAQRHAQGSDLDRIRLQVRVNLPTRCLSLVQQEYGKDSEAAALMLTLLASGKEMRVSYREADECRRQALSILTRKFGPLDPRVLYLQEDQAFFLFRASRYAEAEALARQLVESWTRARGANGLEVGHALYTLGLYFSFMQDFTQARQLAERAVAVQEKAAGTEAADLAPTLGLLANATVSDTERARAYVARALLIAQKHADTHPQELCIAETCAALVWIVTLDAEKGVQVYQMATRALVVALRNCDLERAANATYCLATLAVAYSVTEPSRRTEAEQYLKATWELGSKIYGTDNPMAAIYLLKQGDAHAMWHEYDNALAIYRKVLDIFRARLGDRHPLVARVLEFMGNVRMHVDYARAEQDYKAALAIWKQQPGFDMTSLQNIITNLAAIAVVRGHTQEATDLALTIARSQDERLGQATSSYSERQLALLGTLLEPYAFFATMGDAPRIALAVLRHKALVLDCAMENRRVLRASRDAAVHDMVVQLAATRRDLLQMEQERPQQISEAGLRTRATEFELLSSRAEKLETALARKASGIGASRGDLYVKTEDVQAKLPADAVLVEYLRYPHILAKDHGITVEERYGAVALAHGGAPRWVPLGPAAQLNAMVVDYRQRFTRANSLVSDADGTRMLKKLHDALWAPIERQLPTGIRRIVVSPDDTLCFLPFATLMGSDGRFLAERYDVSYVTSGRDLLRAPAPSKNRDVVVFGDPDYEMSQTQQIAAASLRGDVDAQRSGSILTMNFPRLPGTVAECNALVDAARHDGWTARPYMRDNATKAELMEVHSPRILHLATHGFFTALEFDPRLSEAVENDIMRTPAPSAVVTYNPMAQSGLVLAGCQATLVARRRGETVPIENDGIVTAGEVCDLDLMGTWLVTLSACGTGYGEKYSHEGVVGLRRAFVQAGAQNLLMTLWSIDDETTSAFMADFYKDALRTKDAPGALARTQRDWLVKLRNKMGTSRAVLLVGPFIMSSVGKL